MFKSQTFNQKHWVFLLMFSIVTFHLEIISANMTFTANQSMIFHLKDIYRRQFNVISVENISRRNKNHGTLAKKQIHFVGNLLKISTFQTSVTNPTPKLVTSFFLSPEITHWAWALNKWKRGKKLYIYIYFFFAQYPRNWRKHLCVCLQLLDNLQQMQLFFL